MCHTIIGEEEVSGKLGVGPTNHRQRQFFSCRDVGDGLSFARQAAAQCETLPSFLEHGVRVASVSLRRATSGRQRMRKVDESDIESLTGQSVKSPRSHVRATSGL